MKTKWLWLAMVSLAGGLAWAGSQPDEVIYFIQQTFRDAKTPTLSQLKDKPWICSEYDVDTGDRILQDQASLKFSSGTTTTAAAKRSAVVKEPSLIINSGSDSVKIFILTRDHLRIGTSQEGGQDLVHALLINSKGDLLRVKIDSGTKDLDVASLLDPKNNDLVSYTVCPANKINSAAKPAQSASTSRCGFPRDVRALADRIRDCAIKNPADSTRKSTISSAVIKLAAQTDSGKQVWVDDTGLLIGDRREETMNWENAKAACGKATETEGFIPGVEWQLMTGDEQAHIGCKDQSYYNKWEEKTIEGNGLWEKLPHMSGHFFWSSSWPSGGSRAWGLDGADGVVHNDGRVYGLDYSVRCVGR